MPKKGRHSERPLPLHMFSFQDRALENLGMQWNFLTPQKMEMTDSGSRLEKARIFLISLEHGMGIKSREWDLTKAIGSRMLL